MNDFMPGDIVKILGEDEDRIGVVESCSGDRYSISIERTSHCVGSFTGDFPIDGCFKRLNKFRVGDEVIISDDLRGVIGNYVGIVRGMLEYSGAITRVCSIREHSTKMSGIGVYKLDIDGQAYVWDDSMLISYADYANNPIVDEEGMFDSIDSFLSGFEIK